jgi:hypothetical protein
MSYMQTWDLKVVSRMSFDKSLKGPDVFEGDILWSSQKQT